MEEEKEQSTITSKDGDGPKFSSLKDKVNKSILRAVKKMGFKAMTPIQSSALPLALMGRDIVATAKTGSGKTLAFLIPVVQLAQTCCSELPGVLAIVVCPTRELAMQSRSVLQDLTRDGNIGSALLIGGESRKNQAFELEQGVQVLVATPGRLLDHMKARSFRFDGVRCLVLDEADKILQYGFEEDLKAIIEMLPKQRQTMLFSATRSERTEALSALAMHAPHYVSADCDASATVEGLEHGYVICETKDRLWWLFTVLKKTRKQKVMVFFSSCKSVEFHHEFFRKHCHAPVACIHGKMNQDDRSRTMAEFYGCVSGCLLCTDVAARGLDIPAVDLIVQFDPPPTPSEYIHRVGRTARGVGGSGKAVLLLRPEEREFLEHLKESKVYLELYKMWDDFDNLQPMLEKVVKENPGLQRLATEAYEAYIKAFSSRKLKQAFNVMSLDLDAVSRSFGLERRPDVDICFGFKKKHRARKRMAAALEADITQPSNSKR